MAFQFVTAGRIEFGAGVAGEIGSLARTLGSAALVVTGSNPDRHGALIDRLGEAGLRLASFQVAREPDIASIAAGRSCAREAQADCVVAIGGGSVIDAAKAIAALVTNGEPLLSYLEVIGEGRPLAHDPLPLLAVPTTAGTGSEVTANAVITAPDQGLKVSLRDRRMMPDIALADPELTYDLPWELTISTGLDALTQVIEPFVSVMATPLTDALCRDAIRRGAGALPGLRYSPRNAAWRADMMLTSLIGGMVLTNAKLGAVHGFAGVIGGLTHAPHGAICGTLLPHVTEANVAALRRRAPGDRALRRYREVAGLLSGQPASDPDIAVTWLRNTVGQLGIPTLEQLGVKQEDFGHIAAASAQASSMKGNPIELTEAERLDILEAAF